MKNSSTVYLGYSYSKVLHFIFLLVSIFLIFDVSFKQYVIEIGFGAVQKAIFLTIFFGLIYQTLFVGSFLFPKDILLFFSASLFVGLVSSFFNGDLEPIAYQVLLTYQGILVFFVLYNLDINIRQAYRYLVSFIMLGVLVLAIAFLELIDRELVYGIFHSGGLPHEAIDRGDYSSVQSVFGHPGLYSWYMAFVFSICCGLWLDNKKYLYSFLGILCAIGVVISLRRKTIISLIIVFIFFIVFFLNKNNRKYVLFFGICGFLLLLTVFNEQIIYLFQQGFAHYYGDEYYSPRNILLFESISLANSTFPLGEGYGTFGSWMSRVNYSDLYIELGLYKNYGMTEDNGIYLTDTYWPMIIAELGWIGFTSVVLLWFSILRRLVINFKQSSKPKYRVFHCAASLVLVQVLCESIASPSMAKAPEMFFVMLLAGVSCRLALKEKVVESAFVS